MTDARARRLALAAKATLAAQQAAGPRPNASVPLVRQLARSAAMIARVRASKSDGAIVLQGDSTSFGTNAPTRLKDYAHRLAGILTASGVPAETDSIWGFSTLNTAALLAWDNRLTFTGGTAPGAIALNGTMFKMSASGDGLTFTPEKSVDTFDIWYPADGQFGAFTIGIDNSTTTAVGQNFYGGTYSITGGTISYTGGAANTDGRFGKVTVKIDSVGTHTLKIAWSANGSGGATSGVQIAGIHGYRSDLKQVGIYNWGRPGETAAGWASGGSLWNWMRASGGRGPAEMMPIDLVLLDLGINDANTGVPPSTYATAMQSLITKATSTGHDLGLIVPVPTRTSNIALATQQAIRAQIEALSIANAAPIIADMPQRWGEYDGGLALGYYAGSATDGIHPGDVGYGDKGQAVARVLLGL